MAILERHVWANAAIESIYRTGRAFEQPRFPSSRAEFGTAFAGSTTGLTEAEPCHRTASSAGGRAIPRSAGAVR